MSDQYTGLTSLSAAIQKGVDNKLKDVHTAMPGIIKSFNSGSQTVSVQPAIKRLFITREEKREIIVPADLPLLINVPIIYPRGGGFSITFPISEGDECLLIFCERSIDNWYQTGKVSKPGARRMHSLSDAIAYVGLSSSPNKIPSYSTTSMELKADNGSSKISIKDGSIDINSGVVNVNAPVVNISGDNTTVDGILTVTGNIVGQAAITAAGNMETTGGDLKAGGTTYNTHTHSQAADNAGDTQQDTGGPQ